jgi:poly-gamma-glutamate synthesis protein (capsule biosynthesis protein)
MRPVAFLALWSLLALASARAEESATPAARYDTLTVVLGGDLGLGSSGAPVDHAHAVRHGARVPVAAMARGLAGALEGDVVFANLETVVTERNDLGAVDKAFNFRSHPDGVRQLVRLGFNVFSTANNHAIDYGAAGMADTIRHLEAMKPLGLAGAPGLGIGRAAALAPATLALKQGRVLVAATGIGGPGTGGGAARPAMASFHSDGDLREQGFELRDAEGDIRILSVHFGIERSVRPSTADERRLRDAVENFDIDIVAGHHAHVAAGVQSVDGRMIFYGLGNLMHPGMQDMDKFGLCRDFGVLARVHFGRAGEARYRIRAVEVRTLAEMHAAPTVRRGADAVTRIAVLNHLAAGLDGGGNVRGVRFTPEPDGVGLHCTAHAHDHDDPISRRCRAISAVPVPAPAAAVAAACGRNEPALVARGETAARISAPTRVSDATTQNLP